ncbi:MAG: DNA repair protein RadA [Leptospiraceae bacterium]|nr:DNA repair protein RadA [Leptospiraceae bacterium]MCP5500935.1 DNA repair protein RadA [Leptospiraceae bacterium]
MKKKTKNFICQECGTVFSRWAGKCSSCGTWSSIIEEVSSSDRFSKPLSSQSLSYAKPVSIQEVEQEEYKRIKTGLSELDLVLGGGIVPGSLVLIGGEPGVGKSTLILEISRKLAEKNHRVIYVSGEESPSQISLRARRMKIKSEHILISGESYVENISAMILQEKPSLVFVDSIQTIHKESLMNQAGTITQLRECTQELLETAKKINIPIFIIGHITKEGNIAGPKVLEHLVDTVLYFEGDKLNYYRILRAAKNRFGAVGDIAVFEMYSEGLREVIDRNLLFISRNREEKTGSVLSAIMEGSRALTVEVQALVSRTSFSQARRMAEGLDNRRLVLMAAVIEKYLDMRMIECDIFSNLTGGLNVDEPALDLAICVSIISSYLDKEPRGELAVIGEVGLSGEIRPVSHINTRIKELQSIGIEKILIPEGNITEASSAGKEISGIRHIREIEKVFA